MSRQKKGKPETYEPVREKSSGARASAFAPPQPAFEKGTSKESREVSTDITERQQVEEALRRSREQLRNLSRHLQSIREEESKRIAREIHDELGQSLTALKMDLSWLTSRLPEDLRDRKLLVEKTRAMAFLIDKTILTVQKISSELRPGLLDDLGLIPAIEWQTQEFQKRTGIDCQLDLDCETIDLDSDRSTAIFRVYQEALTNIARHSLASRVHISLKKRADILELQVTDNGVGITDKAIRAADSLGLMGMKERLHACGGGLKIRGSPEKGTTLTVVLPLKESRER